MKTAYLILIIAIPCLMACEHREPEPRPELSQLQQPRESKPETEPVENAEPKQITQPEPVFRQPDEESADPEPKPLVERRLLANTVEYRLLGAPKPLHYGGIFRWQVKIELPKGLERKQVAAILEKAARDIAQGQRADAVAVLAYIKGDDLRLPPSVGDGVLAPNGEWTDAGEPDPIQFKVLYIRESYLYPSEATELFTPGTEVELQTSFGSDFIRVSRRKDEWGEDVEIASVPGGTRAVILKRSSEPLTPEIDFVRYRIEFEYEGKAFKGWVHKSAVEGEKKPDSGG